MWARPRATIQSVWRVFAGLKARCSGVFGPPLRDTRVRGKVVGPKAGGNRIEKIATVACAPGAFLLDLYNIRTSVARAIAHKQQSSILFLVGTAHLLSCSIVRESTATRLPPSPSVRYAARRVETLHVLCVLSCAPALHVHADLCGGWAAREENVRREEEREERQMVRVVHVCSQVRRQHEKIFEHSCKQCSTQTCSFLMIE